MSFDPPLPSTETKEPRAPAYVPVPPVIAPFVVAMPGLTSACSVSVPPDSVMTPEQTDVDLRKFDDPFVVTHSTWGFPTTLPLASAIGLVKT